MSTLFYNRYRIASIRLPYYDYSQAGYYFVTLCTKKRYPWFGDIHNKWMCVNEIGTIVYHEWLRTAQLRQNILLDQFIIMPDHFHGIIIIKRSPVYHNSVVETLRATSLPNHASINAHFYSNISPKSNALSTIIRAFKSAVTNKCHASGHTNFYWQPRYYERIIRTQRELNNVRHYILNNPKNW